MDLALAHERMNSLQTAACPAPTDGKTARFTPVRYGGYLAGLQNFLLDPPPSLRCGPDSLPARIATHPTLRQRMQAMDISDYDENTTEPNADYRAAVFVH